MFYGIFIIREDFKNSFDAGETLFHMEILLPGETTMFTEFLLGSKKYLARRECRKARRLPRSVTLYLGIPGDLKLSQIHVYKL